MSRVTQRDITHSLSFNNPGTTMYGKATAVPFANATQLTIHLWLKIVVGAASQVIFETSTNYGVGNSLVLYWDQPTHRLVFGAHDAVGYSLRLSAVGAVDTVSWVRVTMVLDQTLASLQTALYLNGSASGTIQSTDSHCLAGIATDDLYIGMRGAATFPFTGNVVVDRITIGKAYSAAEVLSEYQTGRYPTGGTILASYDWTPNNSMTVVTDSGTGAKNITLTAPVWSLDTPVSARHQKVQIPYSVQINAIGDKITVGNAASLQTANGTVAFWTKIPKTLTASATFWGLVAKDNAWLICTLNSIATPVLGFYDYATTTHRTSNYYINDDRWHWVAFVYQSGVANGSAVYVDGCMVVSGLMTKNNDATQMAIGGYASASAAIVGAYYADASFHNVALTPAQIRAWYLTGRKPTTGLVSTWPITEGTGTVIADTTGTNTGTLT